MTMNPENVYKLIEDIVVEFDLACALHALGIPQVSKFYWHSNGDLVLPGSSMFRRWVNEVADDAICAAHLSHELDRVLPSNYVAMRFPNDTYFLSDVYETKLAPVGEGADKEKSVGLVFQRVKAADDVKDQNCKAKAIIAMLQSGKLKVKV